MVTNALTGLAIKIINIFSLAVWQPWWSRTWQVAASWTQRSLLHHLLHLPCPSQAWKVSITQEISDLQIFISAGWEESVVVRGAWAGAGVLWDCSSSWQYWTALWYCQARPGVVTSHAIIGDQSRAEHSGEKKTHFSTCPGQLFTLYPSIEIFQMSVANILEHARTQLTDLI